jgi:hypothetical protein
MVRVISLSAPHKNDKTRRLLAHQPTLPQSRIRMKKRPRIFTEFKNIRLLPSGYQVVVTRNKKEFSKHFAGHSKQALKAAERWRDSILRLLPDKRKRKIPRSILAAVGRRKPAVGISRYPERRFYQVAYRNRNGAVRARTFSWSDHKGEIRAYAAAIRFRRALERRR